MRFKTLLTYACVVLCCVSCSNNSIPRKGYEKYKEANVNYIKSIGGSEKNVTFNSCSYVHITGDGTMTAGNLKDSVYYNIFWTLSFNSTKSSNVIDYPIYYSNIDYITSNSDSTAYYYAYELVKDGSLSGKIGSL